MDSIGSKEMADLKENESEEVNEEIELLLHKSEEDKGELLDDSDLPELTDSAVAVSIGDSSHLNICHVSLSETGMILESSDLLENGTSIQLEDGTTAFVHNFESVDESDSGDATTKFIDGQAVQLEDGSTAFIHAAPREGLQPVQLEDGTVAYLSQPGADIFNGETAIDINQLTNQTENQRSSTNRSEKSFKCEFPDCNRLYTTMHHLKVHERAHTGERPYKCKAIGCGKAFATGYSLKSHTRVHTGETPYKCPEEFCGKAFKTSGDLQKHVRTHTGERPFKCSFSDCARAFTTSNILKVHMRTHTGEKPYICIVEGCGKAFASATNYKNHIRIHTGEKPYICSVAGCNKRFTEYSSLYKHHVVHTHSKPYPCNFCGKNYRQASTLSFHRKTVHGVVDGIESEVGGEEPPSNHTHSKLFPCDFCGKSYRQALTLALHKRTVHGALDGNESEPGTEEPLSETPKSRPIIKRENDMSCKKPHVPIIIRSSNAHQNSVETVSSQNKPGPTIVTLQSDQSANQILKEHPVYAFQLQEDGTLSTTMQQIVLVTDPSHLAALQQLAQQGQFEAAIAAATSGSGSNAPASSSKTVTLLKPNKILHCKIEDGAIL